MAGEGQNGLFLAKWCWSLCFRDDGNPRAFMAGLGFGCDADRRPDRGGAIRSTIAGASVITEEELVSMIGHEGAKLGLGLEFR